MALNLKHATMGEIIRLEHIQKYLKLSSNPDDAGFFQEAIDAAVSKVKPLLKQAKPTTGEAVLTCVAESFGVHFEEVRSHHDIRRLEDHYLETQREISFAQLRKELDQPGIDALLFQLSKPDASGNERFVAVLDLRQTDSRAYWDRSHELSHRLAEPPQRSLPFRRHQGESHMPVEKLMDGIAAEIAFYRQLFKPIVSTAASTSGLTFQTILRIRNSFSPTASLLSVVNAVAKYWPRPAMVLTAEMRGRRRQPKQDVALRVSPQAANSFARATDLFVPDNMRVPSTSPLFAAFTESGEFTDFENLHDWTSSDGGHLANVSVLTSAFGFNGKAYAVMSVA